MDRDVASVFDDLIPDPDEASPPSLGGDNGQPEPDEEIVDEVYGNTTRLGMPSEVAEDPDDMSHHSTDDDNTHPGIKRFRLGNASAENTAQKFLHESSGTEVSEPVADDDPDWAEWGDQLNSDAGAGGGVPDEAPAAPEALAAHQQGGLSADENTAARSTSLASEFATPAQDVQVAAQQEDSHDHTGRLDSNSLEALRTGVLEPAGSGRLSPGDSDASDLQIPEPSEATEAADGPEVIETQMGDLWERRSAASAPGMGIIKRPLAADTLYKRVQEIDTPHRQTLGVDLHAKSKLIVSCGADNSVGIWGFDAAKRHAFHIDDEGLSDVIFSPDATMLLAGGTDALVHAWLIPQKTLAKAEKIRHAVLDAHQARLSSLAISDNGKVLLSGSYDGTACAWHLPDGELGATLDGESGPVRGVAFEDKTLLSAGEDGAVRVWNPTGLQIDQLDGFGKLSHLAASPAGSMWGNTDGRVYRSGAGGLRALVSHDDEVSAVDLQKDGAAASAGTDGFVHLYTAEADKPFQSIELPSAVRCLARDDDYLAVGTDDGKIYLYRRG
ncbi:MAG: WD40 repeat domain-containing protein [Persicimonas sp.]